MRKYFIFTLSALLTIAGCSSLETVSDIKRDQYRIAAEKDIAEAMKLIPDNDELYTLVDSEDFAVPPLADENRDMPAWFSHKKIFNYKQYTLQEFMLDLQNELNINFRYLDGINENKSFAMVHNGTVGEALEKLKQATAFSYSIDGDVITWSKFETDYINISFIPGMDKFRIGQQENAAGGIAALGGNNAAAFETVANQSELDNSESFANFSSVEDYSKLKDIEETVLMIKSEEGKAKILAGTSTLFVQDYPENVKRIREFIRAENRRLTAQVFLDIKTIDYIKNYGDEYSLNMTINAAFDENGITTLTNNFAGNILGGTPTILGYTRDVGKYTGSEVFIGALKSRGITHRVTDSKVTITNNTISKVFDGNLQTYLASSGGQAVASVGSNQIAIPGTVKSGADLYAVANINLNTQAVIVTLSNKYSDLVELTPASSGTGPAAVTIQTPNVRDREFFQTFTVKDGETILLSGLTTNQNEFTSNSTITFGAGGEKSATESRTETLILVTPRIIKG